MYDEKKKDIFLSYRGVDNNNCEVTEIKNKLKEKSKLKVYFDKNHMENGDFPDRLRSAVTSCDCFVPIVSENYINFKKSSDWCKKELKLAIKNNKLIVPIFICDTGKVNEKYNIDTTTEKRKDTNIIDEWNDADLIKYLTVSNGVTAISKDKTYSLKEGENIIENCLKNIFNSFCSSDQLTFFHNLLEKQKQALKQVSIQSTSYSFDMSDYIDLGITGKPTKAEKDEAERKQQQDRQRSLNDFLPNLNHFSVEKFIEKFEKERYAVVTGDAGQGKSIFLKQVCMSLCDKAEKNGLSNDKLFPIYAEIKKIPLPKNVDDNYSFFEALAKASVNGITKEQIESVLDNGKLCLILDAMDEVSPTTFDNLHDEILKAGIVDKCYILLSSRPGQKRIKLSNSSGVSVELFGKVFRLWTVDNISDEKFDIFVKNETLKNNYDEKDKNFINKFSNELKEKEKSDDKYKYMSRNPFMLKSIVLTYFGKGVLPKNKVEAFDQAVNNLITREQKGEDAPIELIKNVLGYIAFNSYSELDRKAKDENARNKDNSLFISGNDKDQAINEFVSYNDSNKAKVSSFVNNLVNENGFSHELFACYYCAFYLYKNIIEDENFIEYFLKEINPNADYWRGVIEMLICLFEFNATTTKVPNKLFTLRKLLETMLESMQKVVDTPDYDILCGAVSQFIDQKYNKPMGESVLIKGMLERGERGIRSFDKKTFKCSDGANPYEELFYYVVVHNFVLGLDKIFDENKDKNNLTPIQTHLYNELCKVLNKDNNCLNEKSVDDFTEQFALASSGKRCYVNNFKGHVNIDKKLNYIKDFAFSGCSSLTSISIPDSVTTIEKWAFAGCSALTNITIPDSVTSIGEYAFNGCMKLTNISIPDSVTTIEKWAFAGCSALTSTTIPDSVTTIREHAFEDCSALTSIEVSKGNAKYHSDGNCIFETATNTFILGCKKSVIPYYVTNVGDFAFSGCSELTNISIPDSVKSIGVRAFSGCSSLTSISIPDSVTTIRERAFEDCSALTSIEVSKGNTKYHSEGNCIIETATNTLILGCKNSVIPDYVTNIGDFAFSGCSGLQSITISDSVQSIGKWAFFDCSTLTSITIPDSITSIRDSAFEDCSALTSIEVSKGNTKYHSEGNCLIETKTNTIILGCKNSVIPDYVTNIGDSAFCGCSGLQSITISDSVKSICDSAFWGCSRLTTLSLGKSVQSIGKGAFNGCSALTSITIPNSVTSIGDWAFANCSGLTTLSLGKSIQSIGKSAFWGCSGLTSITIPDSVTSIGDWAFANCSGLTSISIPDSVKSIGYLAFDNCILLKDIFYKGTKEQWAYIEGIEYCMIDFEKCTVHCIDGDIVFN